MATNLKPLPAWLDLDERTAERRPINFTTWFTRSGGGQPTPGQIIDLSTLGCLLSTPGETQRSGFLTVTLPNAITADGWVAWSKNGYTGIDFAHPLQPEIVDWIIASHG